MVKVTSDDGLAALEEALKIDKHELDEAWVHQPDLFYRVTKTVELLISRRDAAKYRHQIVEAEVDELIREEARSRQAKITEREIDAQKLLHKDVRTHYENFQYLVHEVGKWDALKQSYLQRSYALKDLTMLHIKAYYGNQEPEQSPRAAQYDINRRAMAEERAKANPKKGKN